MAHDRTYATTLITASRQRVLSEKITRQCYELYAGADVKEQLLTDLERWNHIHYELQSGAKVHNQHTVSHKAIAPHFDTLNPIQQQMYNDVRSAVYGDGLTRAKLAAISNHETAYLPMMERTVDAIKKQAEVSLDATRNNQSNVAYLSAFILVLEMAVFIYPYHKRLVKALKKLKEQREEIDVQAEQLLHMNETHELTIKGITAGVWDWDIVTGKEVWSHRFFEQLGYEPAEIPATFSYFINHLLHPDDRNKVELAVENHLKNKVPYNAEIRMLNKNGEYRWYEASGQALWNEAGTPLRMAGSLIDINDSVLRRQQIEYNEFLMEEAGNMAKLGGWEYEIATSKMKWSRTMYDINEVPYDDEEILRKSMLERYPAHYHDKISETLMRATKYGEPFDMELQLITAKGNLKWIRSMGVPVKDSNGRIVQLRGVYQDINDRKLKELELEETKEELVTTNRTKDKLFSIVAHDLRTPLAGLSALIEMQQDEIITQEEFMELTRLVRVNLNFLSGTMDNLLQWAQGQMGGIHFSPGRMRVNDTITDAINLYSNAILLKNITVHYEEGKEQFAYADHDQVFLIMRNLVNNAIKFTPERGRIDIITNVIADKLTVTVKDNGVGMSHGALQTILDNKYLFSTQGTMGEKGSGLGLNLCYEMAARNGGSLDVQSEQGKGSSFTLTLPLAA
jgi:PAS domain S-box-containing protein